jgi:DNA recombination protein RmuC
MNQILFVLVTVLLLIIAIIITTLVTRKKYQRRLLELETKSKQIDEENAGTIAQLQTELKDLVQFKALADERREALENARKDLADLQEKFTSSVAECSGLKTQLEQQKSVLDETYKKMETEFQVLAQRMLDDSSQRLGDRSKESLKMILDPLAHDIDEFKKRIDATHDEETKQRASLQEQVRMLADLNQKISKEAENLTKALKGETKTQGTWGEMILEKVLESSGLRKDEEYAVQASFPTEGGKRLQPDVIVHLPGKRDIVVDAKVSLVDYDAFIAADNDGDRLAAASRLAASIRKHFSGLSAKEYQKIQGIDSIDIVVMFVAIEGALSVASMSDRNLMEDALQQNVMLATPTSLLAVLKGIEYGWRSERQSRNVQDIFKLAGDLYDKFVAFATDMDEIGARLGQATKSYDAAKNKLVSGRGNITGKVEKLRDLGVKNAKALPSGWDLGNELLLEGEDSAQS